MAKFWSDEEKENLKKALSKRKGKRVLNWKLIERMVPGKTKDSVHNMIRMLGMSRKLWDKSYDPLLKSLWGQVPPRIVRMRFKGIYSWSQVIKRSEYLGLPKGLPRGMVTIHSLAVSPKWGYSYATTMRIMQWAGVSVPNYAYTGKKPFYCVDEFEAEEAVGRWTRSEGTVQAEKRLGVPTETLRRWALMDGLLPGEKRQIRADPETWDNLLLKYGHRLRASTKEKQQKIHQDCGQSAAQ